MKLSHQNALITGASSGIGKQFAYALAERGSNLILVARRTDHLIRIKEELLVKYPKLKIIYISADLSKPTSAKYIVDLLEQQKIPISILINNAGIGYHGMFADEPTENALALLQINCATVTELASYYLPAMLKKNEGLLINVASTAAFQPIATMAVYGATKAYVLSFTEALWAENKQSGVRIFALCPGATQTEFYDRTGQSFLTKHRQSAAEVVDAALKTIHTTKSFVVSGKINKILSKGYRFLPRRLMVRASKYAVRSKPLHKPH
jgi:short-subunit dehydrogenase